MHRVRVFVSSTMTDLPNERAAVVQKLIDYNLEPVNAEDFPPDGQGSWSLLADEIRSSDVFILILGDRYGWIPDSGAHSGEGLSVTEIEYREARDAGIPVLPFFSRLPYKAGPPPEDAAARDRFRSQVSDWDAGLFRQEYFLAVDLAEKVGRALAALLARRFHESPRPKAAISIPDLPAGTHHELAAFLRRRPVIFAGAGTSLASGLPSASLMMDAMLAAIQEVDSAYQMPASGTAFNVLASDLQNALGREEIERIAQELVSPAGIDSGSDFHRLALQAADLIITTNYDALFEMAIDDRDVVSAELGELETLPERSLVKLHGTIGQPKSLVLSEKDLFDVMERRPRLTAGLVARLASGPVLVIGSSLRDPSVLALFERAGTVSGMYVAPSISQSERRRVSQFGLQPVEVPWPIIVDTFRANNE